MDTQVTLTIPEELYRQALDLARALNRNVADVLAEAIQLETVAADAPETPEMAAEREAFLELHPQLIEKHLGEYVAIHGGQLVDHDPQVGALYARINRRYPDRFTLLRRVQVSPEIEYRFRSPRLVNGHDRPGV
jgi:hypothetical protein